MVTQIEVWLPQEPWLGPPLPKFFQIFWPWYSPPAGVPTLELYDKWGNIIASSAVRALGSIAASVSEGDTVNAAISVTNTSYKVLAGVNTPVPAYFSFQFVVTLPTATPTILVNSSKTNVAFAASEKRTFDKTNWAALSFVLPDGSGGLTGKAQLLYWAGPGGGVSPTYLGMIEASFAIVAAPTVWGGIVAW